MAVTVHIDRLVLEGVVTTAGEREALAASLRSELTRLIAASVPPRFAAGAAVPALRAPHVSLDEPGDAAQAGARIAGAVYSALNPPVRRSRG